MVAGTDWWYILEMPASREVGSDGKFVVNMEKHIDVSDCTPNRRVALRNDTYVRAMHPDQALSVFLNGVREPEKPLAARVWLAFVADQFEVEIVDRVWNLGHVLGIGSVVGLG